MSQENILKLCGPIFQKFPFTRTVWCQVWLCKALKWDVETHICPHCALFSTAVDVALWWLEETFSNILHFKGLSYLQNSRVVLAPILTTTAVYQQCRWGMPLFFEKGQQLPGRLRGNSCEGDSSGSDAPPVWGPHRAHRPRASYGTRVGA